MSDLIDAACDICGRQYRWPDERLGESATCRYCGTKFEVTVYVPPDEDTNAKDLQWFKGVGIAILVLIVVAGLSSLLVLRPSATGWSVAGGSWGSRPNNSYSSTSPSPVHQQHFNPADEIRSRFDQRGPGQGGSIPRGNPVNTPSDVSPGDSTPTTFTSISPTENPRHAATSAPIVTEWGFVGQFPNRKLQLRGTGLQGLTKFQYHFGSGLSDARCNQVSDVLLETDGFHVNSGGVTLYAITNPQGTAVVFSDDIAIVNTLRTLPRRFSINDPKLYLVQSGGQLLSESPTDVLVEQGGRATVNPLVGMAIIKRGGELKTRLPSGIILEAGATLTSELSPVSQSSSPITVPTITFCRLPVISKK